MAKRHYPDWRQFYIQYNDKREVKIGDPVFLSQPRRTKVWKELKRQFQIDPEIQAYGWRTVKP